PGGDQRLGRLRAPVVDDEREPGPGDVGGHRRPHPAQADEADDGPGAHGVLPGSPAAATAGRPCSIHVVFGRVQAWRACSDLSRPCPEAPNPPKGRLTSVASKVFTHTVPTRSSRAIQCTVARSAVHTAPATP